MVQRSPKVGSWPFELANRLGIDSAKAMAEDYCELANFPVPEIWKRRRVLFLICRFGNRDGIATVTINVLRQ